eukprot:scaffold108145_cov19-Tisochrysis_lutea.AAC.4
MSGRNCEGPSEKPLFSRASFLFKHHPTPGCGLVNTCPRVPCHAGKNRGTKDCADQNCLFVPIPNLTYFPDFENAVRSQMH